MKKVFLAFVVFLPLSLRAQQNVFLERSFWESKPNAAVIQAEIDKGNNPAQLNPMSFDAVVNAINAEAPMESLKLLLAQKGNDLDKLTHDSRTYIFWAANRGNLELVEYLISKGAKVNVEDSHGYTPLTFAAVAGQSNTKIYDALIKAGADIKQTNHDGANVLLLAISSDKELSLTNYFVSKGLSLQSTDAAGNTAFNYAARSGNIELMKTLVQKGVKYNNNAMLMAAQGSRFSSNGIEVYQYLESLKIKPNATGKSGENVLHSLVRKPNQQEIIKYFLQKGVDVNKADNEGNTPFMNAAASNRDVATLELLAAQVKDINKANNAGVTALAMAVQRNSADVVEFLLKKGANANTVDAEGNNLAYYLIQSYRGEEGGRQGSGRGGNAAARQGQPASEGAANNRPRTDDFTAKTKLLEQAGIKLASQQKNGNTLYHLAVAKNDLSLLKRLENLKVDVNSKNQEGLTPLHKAAMISKDDAILKYLLSIGAKKETTTEFKETAFDLAKENETFTKNNISLDFLKL